MSGITLFHSESDRAPECTVVFGAGRLQDNGRTDSRRVEIIFDLCYHARIGPLSDRGGIEEVGYSVITQIDCPVADYLAERERQWRATGFCPHSGFYVATKSAWLQSLPDVQGSKHYVVVGRDGYVEVIARSFKWREWLWLSGHREATTADDPVADEDGRD